MRTVTTDHVATGSVIDQEKCGSRRIRGARRGSAATDT